MHCATITTPAAEAAVTLMARFVKGGDDQRDTVEPRPIPGGRGVM